MVHAIRTGNDLRMPGLSRSYVHSTSPSPLLGRTVGEVLDEAARRWPDREALVVPLQQRRLSRADLHRESHALAAGLTALGRVPGRETDGRGVESDRCGARMTVVAQFEIDRSRFIGPNGETLSELPEFATDRAALVDLYRWMLLTRTFDAKAVALQRSGRLGTYASSLGQEAVNIGLAHAMRSDDVLLPSFREHGAQLFPRRPRSRSCFQYWGGDEARERFHRPAAGLSRIHTNRQPCGACGRCGASLQVAR